MSSLTLTNLSKEFPGRVTGVRDVDLHLASGQFLVLLGPSGCGKSTTLRLIAGLERPSRGTIRIGNRDVTALPPKDRDIAMVFQNYALYPHMTVFDNMSFGLKLRGVSKDKRAKSVHRAAEMLGLGGLLHRKPGALSGGEQQRVALGRAIVREPAVFLFDEPLSNLDAKLRAQMRYDLRQLQQELGATMVYVTHDQIEAMTMGDQVAVMNHGQLEQIAPPMTLYDQPATRFVASFLGSPPMNFLEGTLERDGAALFFVHPRLPRIALPESCAGGLSTSETSAPQGGPGEPITLGVRPEHIRVESRRAEAALHGTVDLIEPIGSETLVHLGIHGVRWIARTDPHIALTTGQDVTISIDPARVHLYASNASALPSYSDTMN